MQNVYRLDHSSHRSVVLEIVKNPTHIDDPQLDLYAVPKIKEMLQTVLKQYISFFQHTGGVDFLDIDVRSASTQLTSFLYNLIHTRFHLIFCFKDGISINVTKIRVTDDQQVIREFINFRSDDVQHFSLEPMLQFICNAL